MTQEEKLNLDKATNLIAKARSFVNRIDTPDEDELRMKAEIVARLISATDLIYLFMAGRTHEVKFHKLGRL